MSKLTQERVGFIELLHETFFIRKGHGAFAYISITDILALFDDYLESGEPANLFINRYVRSI